MSCRCMCYLNYIMYFFYIMTIFLKTAVGQTAFRNDITLSLQGHQSVCILVLENNCFPYLSFSRAA